MPTIDQDQLNYIKSCIEAVLFVSDKPLNLDQLRSSLETVDGATIKQAISSLRNEYEDRERGITIIEIAGGYQMLSNPLYATYVRNLFSSTKKERLSRASLETLAIIAYKQPVSRADIEQVRGVNSDGVVSQLLNRELIKCVGRKEVPGRPFIYGTSKLFLEYFGLKSLDDLPRLEEFASLIEESRESGSAENDNGPDAGPSQKDIPVSAEEAGTASESDEPARNGEEPRAVTVGAPADNESPRSHDVT